MPSRTAFEECLLQPGEGAGGTGIGHAGHAGQGVCPGQAAAIKLFGSKGVGVKRVSVRGRRGAADRRLSPGGGCASLDPAASPRSVPRRERQSTRAVAHSKANRRVAHAMTTAIEEHRRGSGTAPDHGTTTRCCARLTRITSRSPGQMYPLAKQGDPIGRVLPVERASPIASLSTTGTSSCTRRLARLVIARWTRRCSSRA